METKIDNTAGQYDGLSPKVRQAMLRLEDKKRLLSFKSNDFNLKCIAFFSANADELAQNGKEEFFSFCEECKNQKANRIIEAIIDRYTAPCFKTDCDTLSFLGLQLGRCGFDDDAVRCFVRAEELITD